MTFRTNGLAIAAVLALALPDTAQALNIVAIGASNTTGFGVGPQEAYPAQRRSFCSRRASTT